MPKYEVRHEDLEHLVGRKLSIDEIEDILFDLKGELDDYSEGIITVDYSDTNRPDMWSAEGLAREIRGYLGIETGCPRYDVRASDLEVRVDPSVQSIRPVVAAAVVNDVNLGVAGYEQLIQLQDKIMLTYGRKRKRVAIGTHNADLIAFPLRYTTAEPDAVSFVPLWETREMTLREILEFTEKGRQYSALLDGFARYPILMDAEDRVVSFPPIINSNDIGNIGPKTKNIFIDVTGTDERAVLTALNAVVAALVERGGRVESVKIVYPGRTVVTPDLSPRAFTVHKSYVERVSGISFGDDEFHDVLARARYDVSSVSGDEWTVLYPAYRADIMHERDVVEDVIIAYGYNRVEPKTPRFMTKGGASEYTKLEDAVKELLIGTGGQEIATFILTSRSVLERAKHIPVVTLQNPMTETFSIVRPALLPTVLDFLSANTGEDYPQRVFEVGDVVVANDQSPTGTRTEQHVAYALADSSVTYTDVRQALEFLLDQIGVSYELHARDYPFYIPGRSAEILAGGRSIGHVGEVHPEVLEAFGIGVPIAAFELSLSQILEVLR
ncbi:MAG: phenylalanine--tRNA ligase subunit beta [Candidatus Diapherotrites archaeon]|nr:phenylalanine--tRNA ligase subunit beta [Candidatus Diapherotrites archaeon]